MGGIPNSPVLPNPLMLPVFRNGLHIRYGEPVEVGPAEESPSDARIQEVYGRYKAALQKLFNKHKDECLPPAVAKKGLIIIERGGLQASPPKAQVAKEGHPAKL